MSTKPFIFLSRRLFFLSLAFILIVSALDYSRSGVFASTSQGQNPQLLNDRPVEEVISDLQTFIPAYMQEQNIPGVAIALIQDS